MKPAYPLSFLQEKIQEIGSALFYNLSNAVLKFPSTVVNTLKVDDAGNIWFFVSRPEQRLSEFDWEFPAKMHFYKKGKGCFLQITGKACVVNDPEEVNSVQGIPEETLQKAFHDMVLVKLKIGKVEYREYGQAPQQHRQKNKLARLYHRFFTPAQTASLTLQLS
jgi:anaerobic selenocysteine-containing dehydrogenase